MLKTKQSGARWKPENQKKEPTHKKSKRKENEDKEREKGRERDRKKTEAVKKEEKKRKNRGTLTEKCLKAEDRDTGVVLRRQGGLDMKGRDGRRGKGGERRGREERRAISHGWEAHLHGGRLLGSSGGVISGHLDGPPEATLYDQIYHGAYETLEVAFDRIFRKIFLYCLIDGFQRGRDVQRREGGRDVQIWGLST